MTRTVPPPSSTCWIRPPAASIQSSGCGAITTALVPGAMTKPAVPVALVGAGGCRAHALANSARTTVNRSAAVGGENTPAIASPGLRPTPKGAPVTTSDCPRLTGDGFETAQTLLVLSQNHPCGGNVAKATPRYPPSQNSPGRPRLKTALDRKS